MTRNDWALIISCAPIILAQFFLPWDMILEGVLAGIGILLIGTLPGLWEAFVDRIILRDLRKNRR